ncbi:hypothetical protein BD410DRAFT_790285 [Rickenella mellea]|uniref:non-specific serine/threonine protein kinase n=1 Tax=Rickenella mellea TaxID=50990 RepID=A0A4Y7PZW0_9AGAM|nr:hypothetical protein BD410DRAFT_790285 [Rickenella mellea]
MPSTVARTGVTGSRSNNNTTETKKKFRTVLGLSPFATAANPQPPISNKANYTNTTHKGSRSIDISGTFSRSSYRRKKARADRSSVTDVSFFDTQPQRESEPESVQHRPALMAHANTAPTLLGVPPERANRRKIVRLEAQDGPWSVSAAETPYDKRSYSIYIKTPTHHLTLTRTAAEIIELHRKLSSSHPDLNIPQLPLPLHDEHMETANGEKKRKSSFLHTLSRLASPGPNRRERERPKDKDRDSKLGVATPSSRNSLASAAASTVTLGVQSPSPSQELNDPFLAPAIEQTPSNGTTGSATITALAAYLTTLSNEATLKHSKAWRRFVRVRTDDLESERVERAVKRVRSDLAAHLGDGSGMVVGATKMDIRTSSSDTEGSKIGLDRLDNDVQRVELQNQEQINGGRREAGIQEENEEEESQAVEPVDGGAKHDTEASGGGRASPIGLTSDVIPDVSEPVHQDVTEKDEAKPSSPVGSPPSPTLSHATIAGRIPRSQSADPDKATRMSRMYISSPLNGEESAMESESETPGDVEGETEYVSSTTLGDDSSASASIRKKSRPRNGKRKSDRSVKMIERKTVIDDFEMMRVLGKGCAGKVLLVKHKKLDSLYALKAITKRHVLAHQELQHTLTEQSVLKRMAREGKDPFVVRLHWSFHDKENLFLVMDFHPGGDLATQLARWGRLGRDRARFYAAEIVEGVDGLHAAGVIYRDLKPENILIGADGHIVLTDFGLSKEFPRRSSPITSPPTPSGSRDFYASLPGTPQPNMPYWMKGEEGWPGSGVGGQSDTTTTFCGTAEYLAPEVIQGMPYSFEVDWWSFGTMLYEMLTGITPFWANNHAEMYARVLQDELKFPDDRAIDQDTKSLIRGLLQRNPALRIKQPRIKRHPYFSMIDWSHVYFKRYIPPYIPPIDPSNASDTQNFDDAFLDMEPVIQDETEQTESDTGGEPTDTDKTDGEDSVRTPAQSRSPSVHPDPEVEDGPDLFDGYSYKGRNSILIDDEDEPEDVEDEYEDEESVLEDAKAAIAALDAGLHETSSPLTPQDHTPEPKTPEQRKLSLVEPAAVDGRTPSVDVIAREESEDHAVPKPAESSPTTVEITPKVDGDKSVPQIPESPESPVEKVLPVAPATSHISKTLPPAIAARVGVMGPVHAPRAKREKSGVPALDKYLSDPIDEDNEGTEREEEDDWDFVEAPGGEERNGAKGPSLFARGVVDRYRLAVFRKVSTPGKNNTQRNFSGVSYDSDANVSAVSGTPSPAEKHSRGRKPPLTFRRNPKQFLRARSPPPSTFSARSAALANSGSATLNSSVVSSTGLLTPSPSTAPSTYTTGPSLKSKESTTSVGSPGSSSDQSMNGDIAASRDSATGSLQVNGHGSPKIAPRPSQASLSEEPEKPRAKKLKKYKEGAEKVLSLFASPRP